VIVTVTLNAAIDRALVVPSFQPGRRHRAASANTSAGGKGVIVARALKRLGIPVVCTGLAGGRTGVQIVERLTAEGILNDFVRIRGESRTSTVVTDPTTNLTTEMYEWGPEVEEHELAVLRDKLAYLSRGAEYVVFSGSLPRGVSDGIYADLLREVARRGTPTVLDCDGEALRLGVDAEPWIVSPNVREAEQLVGHEFTADDDVGVGLDEVAELGARNVLIHHETGCFALLREDRQELRLKVTVPRLDPVSTQGAGDAMLAGYLAARASDRSAEEAIRLAVATGAASVLEVGAGRFEPKEVSRLAPEVTIEPLQRRQVAEPSDHA
jgi:1-phosphofructokinase/tagatose 6-phosphate kinase